MSIRGKFYRIYRGDIIVFKSEYLTKTDDLIIKRVAAVGGDTLRIKNGKVFVNGKEFSAPGITYTKLQARGVYGTSSPITIPKNQYYVLTDNQVDHLLDSRIMGPIKKSDIVGKAIKIIFPFNRTKGL